MSISNKEIAKDNEWYATQVFNIATSATIEFPIVAGVYFLIDQGEVVYVGQSRNIYGRVADHLFDMDADGQKTKVFDSFRYIAVGASIRDEIEQRCIAHFKPKFNGKRTIAAFIKKFGG